MKRVIAFAVLLAVLLTAGSGIAQTKVFKRELTDKKDSVEYNLKAGETYTINMNAKFDTFLLLKDPNGKVVASDDDGGLAKLQARIVYKAKTSGTHTIVATTYKAVRSRFAQGDTGKYTLTIKKGIPADILALRKLFRKLNYKDALKAAKKDGKIIMIDFTAGWCGPCRKMERTTFAKEDVQKFLNKKVISIQVDVDKNKNLAKEFKVRSIPNLVFVDAEGKTLGRLIGYRNAERFMSEAGKVINKKE